MKVVVVLATVVMLAVGCGQSSDSPPIISIHSTTVSVARNVPLDLYGTSAITGKVSFHGTPPKPVPIQTSADPYCVSAHDHKLLSQEVLVNPDATLPEVFVYVKKGINGDYTPPREPAILEQDGCLYRPRVQGMQVGQPLLIRNNDDTLHNIHALTDVDVNPPFNIGQPVRGMESKKFFTQPEVMVHFKCDVHPWMNSYVGVVKHPFFAVTGNNGTFTLPKLPPGQYVVEAWHETFGRQQQTVALGTNETKTIEFTFTN